MQVPPSTSYRVALLFGGQSAEHDVSLASAASVVRAMADTTHCAVPLFIDRNGHWYESELAGSPDAEHAASTGAHWRHAASPLQNPWSFLQHQVDIAFPILHGTRGEDGAVQGLLEILDVPCVGPGVLASAVAMDKALFKDVMQAHGLPVLPWRLVLADRWDAAPDQVLTQLESELGYPMFTKPANSGSSIGVRQCANREQLRQGVSAARCRDHRLVVEKAITPRELEVAVIGNETPHASVVGEIRPKRKYYDYAAKYLSGDSELLIPAPLDPQRACEVRELAIAAYRAIDGSGMARVDLFLHLPTNQLYVNEINTIPGFTAVSMFPALWQASGLRYPELLNRLIGLARQRHDARKQLAREFDSEIEQHEATV